MDELKDTISPRARQFAEKYVLGRRGRRNPGVDAPRNMPPLPEVPPPRVPSRVPLDARLQRTRQVQGQQALHADMAPLLQSVKSASFPDGQYANLRKQDLKAGSHFKAYLAALGELEQFKKTVDPRQPTPAPAAATLKIHCLELIKQADAYLAHYEADLSKSQKAEKTSLSKKRLCEEGRLAAQQYMIALEFDALGPAPTEDHPWDDVTATRAANVRAKLTFHQGYKEAATLSDGGDAQGASESRWVQRGELQSVDDGQGGRQWQTTYTKDAIFKPMIGEEAPAGSSDRPGAGAAKEALASGNAKRFAAMTGLELGVPETNVVSLGRYALKGGGPVQNGPDGQPLVTPTSSEEVIGSVQSNAGATQQLDGFSMDLRQRIPKGEVHKIALLDLMSLTVDRHGGNLMIKNDERSGQPGLVPIDHGGSLPSRHDFPAMKNRFAGMRVDLMSNSVEIVNSLLSMPGAFEPMDAGMQQQLAALDPQAMEAGMKTQRDALDQVHPGLGAGDKVGDDSFHMSRRTMMFTKLAAGILPPAAIQIAVAQHGEALFDVDDAGFDALARQLIAEQAPKTQAYAEIFLGPASELKPMVDWLEASGWTAPNQGTGTAGSGTEFLMRDPALALKLYKSKTTNPQKRRFDSNTMQVPAKAPDDAAAVDDAFKQRYVQDYHDFNTNKTPDETVWKNRKFVIDQIDALGGVAAYRRLRQELNAGALKSIVDVLAVLTMWPAQVTAADQARLRSQRNTGVDLKSLIERTIRQRRAEGEADAAMLAAQQVGQGVSDTTVQQMSYDDARARVEAILTQIQGFADVAPYRQRAQTLHADVVMQDLPRAEREILQLEREANRFALDVVYGEALALRTRLEAAAQFLPLKDYFGAVKGACFNQANLPQASRKLGELRAEALKAGVR